MAFLPRHGEGHRFPPHAINYRANLWALHAAGVRQVLAPCAVGGLRDTVAPGDLVAPDQLVDRTFRRVGSYVEAGAVHLPFADPYCPRLLGVLDGVDDVRTGATMVVVEGPRFSTRAESRHYAAEGWDLVNMTGAPEAALARELRLCYAAVAVVTDMDAGAESGEGVGQAEVFELFGRSLDRLRGVLEQVVAARPGPRRLQLRVVGGRPRADLPPLRLPPLPGHDSAGSQAVVDERPEATQPQAVGDHEDRAEGHRGAGDHRVEQPGGGERAARRRCRRTPRTGCP